MYPFPSPSSVPSPILITGASGFVGEHLLIRWAKAGLRPVGVWRSRAIDVPGARLIQADLADPDQASQLFAEVRPRLVIHAAAMTSLAACEEDPVAARRSIVAASEHVAHHAASDASLLALSTDMVYDGQKGSYTEDDVPNPLNVYGRLKLEAESPILSHPRGCVVRTALVYGPPSTHQGSFLGWMARSLRRQEPLVLFEDEFRTPIHVDDLRAAIEGLASRGCTGLWLAGGPDRPSRVEMGHAVAEIFQLPVHSIRATLLEKHPSGAIRPADASLDSSKLWSELGIKPRGFREGVEEIRRLGSFTV